MKKAILLVLSFLMFSTGYAANPDFNSIVDVSNNATTTLAKAGETLTFTLSLDVAEDSNGGTITFSIGATAGLTATIPAGGASTTHTATYTVLAGQNGAVSITGIAFQNTGLENIINLPGFPHTPGTNVTVDTADPVVAQVTAVPSPTSDTTPNYEFSSTEAGTISYTGDCASGTTAAILGNTTVTFNALADGAHNNCQIKVTDDSGNESNTLSVNNFTVDATDPSFSSFSVTSNNANNTFAKTGDVLTFTMGLNAADTSNGGTITFSIGATAGLTATIPMGGANAQHTGTYTVLAGQNGAISVTGLSFADQAGNSITGFAGPVTPAPTVTIDNTAPSLDSSSIATSGNPGLARAGQTVTFTANFNEIITTSINTASTAHNISTLTSDISVVNNTSGTITFTTVGGDNGTVTPNNINFTITDRAGNTTTINSLGAFVGGPIVTDTIAPTLNPVTITSNNATNTLAKTNDTVTVSFTGSETLTNVAGTILGENSVVTNTGGDNWTSALLTSGNEPEGNVTFTITFEDPAGNTGVAVTAVTNGSAVEFDRTNPMVNSVSIASSNLTFTGDNPTFYAKTGDTITLSFETTEKVQTPTGTVLNKIPIFTNGSGDLKNWTAVITTAGGDAEGTIPFDIDILDLAGNNNLNLTTTTNGTSIVFDRTAPTVATVVTDKLGGVTANFKHRSNAEFTWSGHNDNLAGVYQFDIRLQNTDNGYNETSIVTRPTVTHNFFTQLALPPNDNDYDFKMLVRDKAGNESLESTLYSQKYTIGLVGNAVDNEGNIIHGVVAQAVARYNDTCDTGVETCSGSTDTSGDYAIVLKKDRSYNVTYFKSGYYLAKKDIAISQVDVTQNIVLTRITSPKESQTLNQSVRVFTDQSMFVGTTHTQTYIDVTSLSGQISLSETPGSITISSLGRITAVTSNDSRVVITDNGDNTFTITGAGQVTGTAASANGEKMDIRGVISFGVDADFDSGDSRLGTISIPSTGKGASRASGQTRGEGVPRGQFWTPEQSQSAAKSENKGWKGKVVTYTNRNGYEVFAGYLPGKVGLDRMYTPKNRIKYRGNKERSTAFQKISWSNNRPQRVQSRIIEEDLTAKYEEIKTRVQPKKYIENPYATPAEKAGFKKVKPGGEAHFALNRKMYNEAKVDVFARKNPPKKVSISQMAPKDMSVVKIRINGKSVPMSRVFGGGE